MDGESWAVCERLKRLKSVGVQNELSIWRMEMLLKVKDVNRRAGYRMLKKLKSAVLQKYLCFWQIDRLSNVKKVEKRGFWAAGPVTECYKNRTVVFC